ncbi:MAG: twitching motility protein PilT [Candidatus Bathyarchaeota archaeon B24]|nr:MAG: twitching motility protein PilT [Candidatus Bathyarchaeota archaeon B24]
MNRESGWEEVEDRLRAGCITLELAIKEVGSSLWKRVGRGDLKPELALRVFKDLVKFKPVKLYKQEELLVEAMEYALKLGLTIYDCLFIALAKRLGEPLITSDRKQVEAAQRLNILVDFIP